MMMIGVMGFLHQIQSSGYRAPESAAWNKHKVLPALTINVLDNLKNFAETYSLVRNLIRGGGGGGCREHILLSIQLEGRSHHHHDDNAYDDDDDDDGNGMMMMIMIAMFLLMILMISSSVRIETEQAVCKH